ncbi:MAG TPA: hypothetical protein VKW08_15160 [Xanthobacteraceae bacterium]|nr:hypothetical protein [Xanthobacteraceae bacterium]
MSDALNFVFRCPNTRQEVHAWWLAHEARAGSRTYLPFSCGACQQFHRINPLNGEMLCPDEREDE